MKRTMRLVGAAIASALVLSAVLSSTAAARGPLVQRVMFQGSWETAPGEVCDFAYTQSWNDIFNVITWGDPSNPTRTLGAGPVRVTHTNVTTGQSFSDTDAWVDKVDYVSGTEMMAGITWHLRDLTTGRLVYISAGRVIFDLADRSITFITPKLNPGFADVICPALGGLPA